MKKKGRLVGILVVIECGDGWMDRWESGEGGPKRTRAESGGVFSGTAGNYSMRHLNDWRRTSGDRAGTWNVVEAQDQKQFEAIIQSMSPRTLISVGGEVWVKE